jgi:lambda family phage minor tail protein L
MPIQSEIAALATSANIELFSLDTTDKGGTIHHFHAGTNQLGGKVVWQGVEYSPAAVFAEGFEYNGSGQLPRPKFQVANIGGGINGLLIDFDDLRGCKVIRRRTKAKFLDAVNFPGGVNPTADPAEHLPDEIYFIDRVSEDDGTFVTFEMGASYDVLYALAPGRQIIDNICGAEYRSGDVCDWQPDPVTGPFFDENDAPCTADLDRCSHKRSGCRARFGTATLADGTYAKAIPFGGFPAAGLAR